MVLIQSAFLLVRLGWFGKAPQEAALITVMAKFGINCHGVGNRKLRNRNFVEIINICIIIGFFIQLMWVISSIFTV